MASPQVENGYVRLSNELYEEIFMRDFTKRQRAVLDLIIRLSYGTGKKTAVIPRTKDFQICGIPANKVRKELDGLRLIRVIDWDTSGSYWLNKDYEEWQVATPSVEAEMRFKELLKINLHATLYDQNGHAQNGHDDQKGQQNMPETVISTCPKRSHDGHGNPSGTRDFGLPKDIVKDSIKDIEDQKSEPTKIAIAEFVHMTHEEHMKLIEKLGPEKAQAYIERLDNYKGAKGKRYKSDYRAILTWVTNDNERTSAGGGKNHANDGRAVGDEDWERIERGFFTQHS